MVMLQLLIKISVLLTASGSGYSYSELTQTPSQRIAGETIDTVRLSPHRAVMPQFLRRVQALPLMASHDPVEL